MVTVIKDEDTFAAKYQFMRELLRKPVLTLAVVTEEEDALALPEVLAVVRKRALNAPVSEANSDDPEDAEEPEQSQLEEVD